VVAVEQHRVALDFHHREHNGLAVFAAAFELAADLDAGRELLLGDGLDRALAQFEEFCTVTKSVRQSLPVRVTVIDADGRTLRDQT
jgi:hypothetical protein